MNHKEIFNGVWKVLLIAALVIASISLGMNIMRVRLERRGGDAQPSSSSAAQEDVAVINVLAAGRAYYGLYTENKEDYWDNFSGMAETVANYDLAAYSQQTLIGTEVPWQFAEAATGIGFNLIGLADPHVLAYGKAGIDSSMDYWLDNPDVLANGTFISTDSRNLIPTIRTGEVTAAFLSFTDDMNHEIPEQEQYLVNVYDDEKSPAQVAKAAEQADVVIVEMWWDGEDGKLPELTRFPKIKFLDAKQLFADAHPGEVGIKALNEPDFAPEEEKWLGEYFLKEFGSPIVFVTHYPAVKRPFYAMNDPENPNLTLSFDMLLNGLEVTTGGQRIHDYEMQIAKMKERGMGIDDFEDYLTMHKYGMPPHGGIGLGMERIVQNLLGLDTIKKATAFPRDRDRLRP